MRGSKPGPKRLKGLLPPEIVVEHKTGTGSSAGDYCAATNDIGIVNLPQKKGALAICVYLKAATASLAARERTIAMVARAAYDHWTQ